MPVMLLGSLTGLMLADTWHGPAVWCYLTGHLLCQDYIGPYTHLSSKGRFTMNTNLCSRYRFKPPPINQSINQLVCQWVEHSYYCMRSINSSLKQCLSSWTSLPLPGFPQGLENCGQLEELSLEHNCLTKIEGLSKLGRLKRLALGHNFLTTLEDSAMDKLVSLTFLSLENNRVTSLMALRQVNTLVEVYIGNNMITNIREVFYLKVSGSMWAVVTSTRNRRLAKLSACHLLCLATRYSGRMNDLSNDTCCGFLAGRLVLIE